MIITVMSFEWKPQKGLLGSGKQREEIRFGTEGNVINNDNICFLFY
jgi:hypothetical protein